jgi:hypothetical protein
MDAYGVAPADRHSKQMSLGRDKGGRAVELSAEGRR